MDGPQHIRKETSERNKKKKKNKWKKENTAGKPQFAFWRTKNPQIATKNV